MDVQTLDKLRYMIQTNCNFQVKRLEPLTMGGSTAFSQILYSDDNRMFLVKLIRINDQWQEYLNTLKAIGSLDLLMPRLEAGFLFQPRVLCLVTEWVTGTELIIQEMKLVQLDHIAEKLAKYLRCLHTFPVQEGGREYSIAENIWSSLAFLEDNDVMLPHQKLYSRYLEDPENSPYTDARRGYIHFDLHRKNILCCQNGDCCLIDWEITGVSDVWRDFVYAVCIHQPEEQEFWLLLLLHYFEDAIPECFFTASRFYTVLFMMMLVHSNCAKGTMAQHSMLAQKIFDDYHGLKCTIPIWMKKSAERLLATGIGHQDELTRLICLIKEELRDTE